MPFNKLFFVLASAGFLTFSSLCQAANPYSAVQCGDHWLSVDIALDPTSNNAEVNFGGDSQPEPAVRPATYEFLSDDSVKISFSDSVGGYIEIQHADAGRGIFWGVAEFSAPLDGRPVSLGICNVL